MITIGTDDLILHARKSGHGTGKTTVVLARLIGNRIRKAGGIRVVRNQPCRWGNIGSFINAGDLPKTATQFSLDPTRLPEIYKFVGKL